ncbi:MAG: prepilin-type N-terminal cleavage/methylation domain-containing protein [Bacilli bacterium]|nr:prepilin-type N-terminal cleavage/methylation domain-containing protein [Bacilli bacterium]
MKNRKGFTLVELLAVITILSVILIIAVPQIMNTIKVSKLGAMESSAKIIAKDAEKKYYMKKMEDKNYAAAGIPCTDITKMSSDYGSCTISYSNNGIATVTLKGATGGKFDGITCTGTKNNMSCVVIEPEPEWVYAFGNINSYSEGESDFNYLEDSQRMPRRVFIRYNKNNLSEKYVCTTYNITNGKPTCISINAYDTRNNANSEWSKMIELFGEENCSSGTNVVCGSHISQTLYWGCRASDDEIRCDWETNSSFNTCSIINTGDVDCRDS